MTEVSKRTHGVGVANRNKALSPDAIRSNKCQRSKARGVSKNLAARFQADQRTLDWNKLSAAQKIAALDARLGKGVGAKKQRARLQLGVK